MAYSEAVLGIGPKLKVIAVYTNFTPEGKPEEPVKTSAVAAGIPVHQHKSLKATDAALNEWLEYKPHLVLLCYVTQYVPETMISIPSIGCACFHPSLLPKYRGGSALQWQIIDGQKKGGLSWFWLAPAVGSKVDDGPICLTAEVDIDIEDTSASLYFNKIFPLGVKTCVDVVELCLSGNIPRVEQNETEASWQPLCNDKVAKIDFSKSTLEIYNFIRGCDPQPGAFIVQGETQIRFFGAKLRKVSAECEKGTVVEVSEEGIVIFCGNDVEISDFNAILITKIKGQGAKISAKDFAAANGITVGTSFL